MPPPHESQPDVPQEASPEEEPFEIELVVPESPTAQDSPAEEQQQPEPRRCTEVLTRWSPLGLNLRSSPANFGLCWST
jgi:hypothetical protein